MEPRLYHNASEKSTLLPTRTQSGQDGKSQTEMKSYDTMKVTEGSKVIGQAIKSSRILLCLVATS